MNIETPITDQCEKNFGEMPGVMRELEKRLKKIEAENKAQLDALKLLWAFVDDLGKSNPGYLGKLVLRDYAQMNEAFVKTEQVLRASK